MAICSFGFIKEALVRKEHLKVVCRQRGLWLEVSQDYVERTWRMKNDIFSMCKGIDWNISRYLDTIFETNCEERPDLSWPSRKQTLSHAIDVGVIRL